MPNVFVVSDTHFGHDNIYTFTGDNGVRIRPEFKNATQADEAMIVRWNEVVKPGDKVYHLGDVSMGKRAMRAVLPRLNGRKCLIKGNHDNEKLTVYREFFYDVRGSHLLDRCILTHIPIHPMNLNRFKGNFHGHIHERLVTQDLTRAWPEQVPDHRYLNLCVEQIDYTPMELSVALARIKG